MLNMLIGIFKNVYFPSLWSDLGGHAVAGVEDGFVVVLGALVQTVAASFAVPHLKDNRGGTGSLNSESTDHVGSRGHTRERVVVQDEKI